MSVIAQHLEQRFPNKGRLPLLRAEIQRVCEAFVKSGLADSKFEVELTGGSDNKFWSCVSEAFVYERLKKKGLAPSPKRGVGPDFLLIAGDRRVWVEVICPKPSGLDPTWLDCRITEAGSVPHDAILLRWTSAIKEKAEKLLGSSDGSHPGYVKAGVVQPEDAYVIAVNGCRMRNGPFPSIHGISRFPYAAEAVFPIGPYQLHFDRKTLKKVGEGHQHRLSIPKSNGSAVPIGTFLDPSYAMISAIWGVDFNGAGVIGNPEPSVLIHNPNACNPLAKGLLPCDEEYEALLIEGGYNFGRTHERADG